jgi:TldD protein
VLDPDLVRDVLGHALASGGRFAEVFAEARTSTSIRLDDRKIEEVVSGGDRGAGIRVFHGGSQAYAYSNRLDPEALREAARAAASAVRGGGQLAQLVDLRRGPTHQHDVETPAEGVSRDRKVGWLREADDQARSVDPSVRQVLALYADSFQRVLVANSDGLWAEEERPRVRLAVQVVAARDGVVQMGFDGPAGLMGVELMDRYPPAETARKAARQAVAMLDGRPAPAGEMPVVLGPGGGGILFHEACGHGLEADHVQKDASVFKGRLGEALASPLVNGVDDGTVPGAWGSSAVDDEGTPMQRTVLFEDGTLVSLLYDRLRAEHFGTVSTGNGRRQSYASLPIPRMRNSSILPGEQDPEEIVAGTSRGLYAKALGGGQVNPATGDFVFGVSEGYLIEEGRITAPVRGANLIGNGPHILAAIDAVAGDFETRDGTCGKEGQGAPVSNGSPTLRIARMTVGGTEA